MYFLIVTGLSGSGKSRAISMLEDMDFVCVDNLPPELLPAFGQIQMKSESDIKTAVVIDSRSGVSFGSIEKSLEELKDQGVDYKILFLDCSDDVLMNRFKETRRRHPLSKGKHRSVEQAIEEERKLMAPLKSKADFVIDTTKSSPKQLKERIAGLFYEDAQQALRIQCLSFGFKHGVPADADLIFDVRCLPNPFYIKELKPLTGLDSRVQDYVMNFDCSKELLKKITELIDFTIPLYLKEGKSALLVAFGCTGGKHRSVTFAELLNDHLREEGLYSNVTHRDILKPGT